MARVLVIGGGGREHALAWKLLQSPKVEKLFVAPGNAGTAEIAENVPIHFTDAQNLLAFARQERIDLTVIGQEAASEAGVVDEFLQAGMAVFGPSRAAARIETSKAFAKELMRENHIPTAPFRSFTATKQRFPGWRTGHSRRSSRRAGWPKAKASWLRERSNRRAGRSANHGRQEIRCLGRHGCHRGLPAWPGDLCARLLRRPNRRAVPSLTGSQAGLRRRQRPNTGGMGVMAPVSWVTRGHLDTIQARIVQPALDGLRREQAGFVGCLYPGLMIDGEL